MLFLLTPLREGRPCLQRTAGGYALHFYSRPCGRGDPSSNNSTAERSVFLLTPLREGRPISSISTACPLFLFLLTPLREGRRLMSYTERARALNFYSRPCGRGDVRKARLR